MTIRWEFRRAAARLVAAQQREVGSGATDGEGGGRPSSDDSDSDCDPPGDGDGGPPPPPLAGLDRWTVERSPFACDGDGDGDDDDDGAVYLLHPPVLMPSLDGGAHRRAAAPSSSGDDDGLDPGGRAAEFDALETWEEDDGAAAARPGRTDADGTTARAVDPIRERGGTEWTFSVVFHPAWRVPTLYFTCNYEDGSPLRRREVLDVLLSFGPSRLSDAAEGEGGGVGEEDPVGPVDRAEKDRDDDDEEGEERLWEFVSQEEHPHTGAPSYFLHPCRTAERMEVLLGDGDGGGRGQRGQSCPLLSWMSMILPAVGCRVPARAFRRMSELLEREGDDR